MKKASMTPVSGGGLGRMLSAKGFTRGFCASFAFTLAEVLITLGIIGVVAALTLPTLINKTQDKILASQYSKSKNILANGYKLMMAKYEIFKVPNLPILNECNSMMNEACMSKEHKKAFNIVSDSKSGLNSDVMPNEYIIQGKSDKSPFKWSDVPYIFSTTDGMTYGVIPDDELQTFSVVADVNGVKNPNTVKKDLYKFRYAGNGQLSDVSSELEKVVTCSVDNPSGCDEESCRALIQFHGSRGDGALDSNGNCKEIEWWDACYVSGRGGYEEYYCR